METLEEAQHVLPSVSSEPLLMIGRGSNLLLTKDFDGVVVRSGISGMDVADEGGDALLRCGSGVLWDNVVEYAVRNGFYGVENLSLIPGDVGASAVQNIGAYGVEIKDFIDNVEAVEISTGRCVRIEKDDCRYTYRGSRFKKEWRNRFFITRVTYRLKRVFMPQLGYGNIRQALAGKRIDKPTARDLRSLIIGIRREKLPDTDILGNAGSFFMNPIVKRAAAEQLLAAYPAMPVYDAGGECVKLSAGWMIEQCGWKGRSLGNAAVYGKQALVIINKGGATGKDILSLCEAIQKDVAGKFNVQIKPEVNIV